MNRISLIAVTGGVASGKSSFCKLLSEAFSTKGRLQRFSADDCAKEILDSDSSVRSELFLCFGKSIQSAEGTIDRAALRNLVFADPEKRKTLEAILHPMIYQRCQALAREVLKQENEYLLAEIPLLYETERQADFHHTIVVGASTEVILQRLINHRGLEVSTAKGMLAAQLPLDRKLSQANAIVWNDGSFQGLVSQVPLALNF